jgi:hypothetical protein
VALVVVARQDLGDGHADPIGDHRRPPRVGRV